MPQASKPLRLSVSLSVRKLEQFPLLNIHPVLQLRAKSSPIELSNGLPRRNLPFDSRASRLPPSPSEILSGVLNCNLSRHEFSESVRGFI